MPDFHTYEIEKHKQNVLHSERRIAETPIKQGQCVMIGSSDFLVIPATLDAQCFGVALNTVDAGDIATFIIDGNPAHVEVEVAMIGVVPVVAGTSLDADDFVISDADGKVVPCGINGQNIIGKVLKDASAEDQETHMLIVYCSECGRGQT
jgi:hypothetical protein